MYRSWHLGRGPGEPPPARGMCTFSGISMGQGGESRWDSGGEPKMPYWSQGHWKRSSLEGISEIFGKQRTSQKDETHSKLMDQTVVPGSQCSKARPLCSCYLMMAMTQTPSSQERKKNPPPFLLEVSNSPGTLVMLSSISKTKKARALFLQLLVFLQLVALPTPIHEFQCLPNLVRAPFKALIPQVEPVWRKPPSQG